jgi:hypothetical protein
MLQIPTPPEYKVRGSLHFIDTGELLFVNSQPHQAKFVTAQDVASAFSGIEQDTGWMPAGVVRAGHNARGSFFVYSTPPQQVNIAFDGTPGVLTIPIPRLVLVGVNCSYYLFASKKAHFDPVDQACYAPFPNVHPDGKICWGSASAPEALPTNARKAWDAFFAAQFNADLAAGKSLSHKDNVCKLLRSLDGKRRFPTGDLVEASYSITHTVYDILGA